MESYKNEIILAEDFLANHKDDAELFALLWEISGKHYSHSERWSKIYDYFDEHYPESKTGVITGLAYKCEMMK